MPGRFGKQKLTKGNCDPHLTKKQKIHPNLTSNSIKQKTVHKTKKRLLEGEDVATRKTAASQKRTKGFLLARVLILGVRGLSSRPGGPEKNWVTRVDYSGLGLLDYSKYPSLPWTANFAAA